MSTVTQTYIGAAVAYQSSPDRHTDYNEVYTSITQTSSTLDKNYLLIRFPSIPDNIRYKKLLRVKIKFWVWLYASSATEPSQLMWAYPLERNFDPETVTWNAMPPMRSRWGASLIFPSTSIDYREYEFPTYYQDGGNSYQQGDDPVKIAQASKKALFSNSIALYPLADNQRPALYAFQNAPQIIIEVDESVTITSKISPVDSPTAGWVNPLTDQTFSWVFTHSGDYPCPGNFEQSSAVFHWRTGTDEGWHDVPASGQSVTIPAGTFPGGIIEWYLSGTDTQGTSSQTSIYTITTEDLEAVATAILPSGTVEDGSSPIVFRWAVANDSGAAPTGADLQSSTDGETWADFAHVSGSDQQYSAPANTFTAGGVFWRVRAYNRDNIAGPWSNSKQFVTVSASPEPVVSAVAVPFATINWQSEGQQAYRVTIDGNVYGPYFGTGKQFSVPDYLTDGEHTVSVEVQNSYGLWSAPGTVNFSIENVPGEPLTLRGTFYRDAALSWSTVDQTTDFFVYRDGVQIGHAVQISFVDRTVLGAHGWQVINRLPGGYYTASNVVQGELRSCCTAIAPLSGGDWLELRKSDNANAEQSFEASRQISLRHFEGAAYPVAEISPFLDQSGSYDAAFLYSEAEAAARFEALLGSTVIVKSRGGECLVGILNGFAKRNPRFFRAYGFSVQRIHWRDFVDEND